MFLSRVRRPGATLEDIEKCMDYLFQEVRDTKEIDPDNIPVGDYEMIREDVFYEFQGFIDCLDKMEDADHPLRERFDGYREALRSAAATIFDTVELVYMFGRDRGSELEEELYYIYWLYIHYKIPKFMYERSKIELLQRLKKQGRLDSTRDRAFLQRLENFFTKSKYCCNKKAISEGHNS